MGKARKHSRGMQAVERDDFGYPRGTDSEMEEEAPVRKRSRFSLNGGDRFGVPKEVLSLSNMLRSEREHLVHKLRMELEQVRELRRKVECFSSDKVMLSPYSDLHSCSDGSRRMPTQGKKRRPLRNDKQRSKKGPASARLDVTTSSTVASLMKECQTLVDRLWSHKLGFPFRIPVDPVLLNIPDYFIVIKHPMDLGTIRSRLRNGEYSSPLDFAADVRLTFSNSMAYNPPGNQYHKMARDLSTYFESRWKTIEKKIPVMEPPVTYLTSSASLESEVPYNVAPPRKNTASVNESKLRVEPAKLVMTDDEKKKLSQDLDALEEFPQNIVDLLKEQIGNDDLSGEVEIEIDIETLSDETLFMVRKLLDDYLKDRKKSQEKSEHCEMEIAHDSGFSNSTLQPSKGDMLIDEDVDIIGGNDPPVSSHPPHKIDKDAACRNNERSSSSSSSRDSGSSSSDSDSCSSSRSETDFTKASNPTSTEDKKEPGVDINGEKIVVNDSLNELCQVEHDVGEKSAAIDAVHVIPEEETAPLERQDSPGKRQRAALLKNRFADTIMKAREKTLTKGEKGDPEKLRIEREKFEKRLREENLRLQAEAKAVEEARRKAKAEAAEKARREREQEREAARQALQKLEKTVEIDEGRRFMEDLEMLRATGAEGDQLPTFMEEMSPKCSPDMLGSFKMEGNSNPLEQLGLYMKMDEDEDDEDDEEDEPHFSQGEVDEQTLDRKERLMLSPHGVEREDQLDNGNKKPASQRAQQDGGNQEDEKSINQKEGEEQIGNGPVSPHGEEVEDQLGSGSDGREEVVSEKAQDSVNHEDEELINQNEGGREQLEIVPEQENGVEDKGDEEADVMDEGDDETGIVDMVGVETEVVEMVKVDTEEVDMREQETEVVGNGEKETEVVDMEEQENEVGGMGDEEAEMYNKDEETGIVDMEGKETEVVDMVKADTEVVDMREQETEVVDMGEEGNEIGGMGEQENGIEDKGGEEAGIVDMGEEETEGVDIVKVETEVVDMRELETEAVDKVEKETEVVVMGKKENEIGDIREQETEVFDSGEEETKVVHKREEETEVVENGEEETEVVDMGEQGNENGDIGDEETEVFDNGYEETEAVQTREEEEKVVGKGQEVSEALQKREEESEVVEEQVE
ncbi:PREDICTED: transcription factor GTE10-like isoform X1 [Brassica oleracea var. oleracea]|uniref:Bromo domain-containing protein n=1 Tax=Brassica oleracea var. oleracea TaxID=109376 RepID=A0A0D3E210_BRAOL|nr:PREDICTED: transcription factor GTE10-like isoform X1 [Brassica oleracea var. oleracea]